MRSLHVHQMLLNDPSPTIHKELNSVTADLEKQFQSEESPLKIVFYLEIVQIYLQNYSEISKVQTWLDYAHKHLQLQATLVGKKFLRIERHFVECFVKLLWS